MRAELLQFPLSLPQSGEYDFDIPAAPRIMEMADAIHALAEVRGDWEKPAANLRHRLAGITACVDTALRNPGDRDVLEVMLTQCAVALLDIAQQHKVDLEERVMDSHNGAVHFTRKPKMLLEPGLLSCKLSPSQPGRTKE